MQLEGIIAWIEEANDGQIDEILAAILRKQKKHHPDWEVVYLSLPLKDPAACREIIINVWNMLCKLIAEEDKET